MPDPTDLIRRGDAYAACELYPPDDWDNDERDGFFSATSQCRAAIRKLPAHPVQGPPSSQPGKEVMPDGSERSAVEDSPGVTAGATRPERLWLWPECPDDGMDKAVSFPDQPYPSGSTEYIRADLAHPAPVVPAEGLAPERLVMAWMAEQEGFATRGERFMETIVDGNDVVPWLHAACQVGIDAALRSAPPVGARVTGWQPIETAPYGVPVRVKLGRGTTIVAVLRNNAAITEDGDDCDQWQAHFEGEHPECWTDGACWQSNADNVMSLQPRAWTALLPAGEGE